MNNTSNNVNDSKSAQNFATLKLLKEFGIDIAAIADHAQVSAGIASSALQPHQMESCPVILLIKVQTAAEILLRQKGWEGDSSILWGDFYSMLTSVTDGQHA